MTPLKSIGMLLAMALGGCLGGGLYLYFCLPSVKEQKDDLNGMMFAMEATAALFYGILIFGLLYCRIVNVPDEGKDIRKFVGWRINFLHFIVVLALLSQIYQRTTGVSG